MNDGFISIDEAVSWLVEAVSADGVLSESESRLLYRFAVKFGLSPEKLIGLAKVSSVMNEPEVVEVSKGYHSGYKFEKFCVENICDTGRRKIFELIKWRGDKRASKIIAKEDKNPDLEIKVYFNDEKSDRLLLECKYRSSLEFPLFDINQIRRYCRVAKEDNLFTLIAVGLGGKPSMPELLYIMPVFELMRREPRKDMYKVKFSKDCPKDDIQRYVWNICYNWFFYKNLPL